ncbi:MAG: cytochrome C [Rhodobacteraceae bacterium]|nr:cytochrome C [Paracoccaceae bacterium]
MILTFVAGPALAQEFTTLKGHGGPIMGLSVAPGGQVATASFDNSVGVWDGLAPTWLDGHDAAVVVVNFDNAPLLYSGGDDFRVLEWHPDGSAKEITRHLGKVSDIDILPAETVIASAGWDGFIQVTWPHMDHHITETLRGHQSNVTSVELISDTQLYSASSDGTIRHWQRDDTQWQSRVVVKHGFGINEMIVTDDWIAYGAVDGGTRVIDRESGQQIKDFTLDRRPILAMAWHGATGQLAAGDGQGYIMMIDTTSWRITRDFRATRRGPVWALAFSPDGKTIYAGGLDDVAYAWPVAYLDEFDPAIDGNRSFLRDAATMSNGERQFMRKCSICHALTPGPSRKAGPTLHRVFGRAAGTVPGYPYSPILVGSDIIWNETSIDALFDEGPDHFIPGSKMPMQVIREAGDRADLITFLKTATKQEADQ